MNYGRGEKTQMFDKVKIVKFILVSILLIIVAIIPGELFQAYLDQYNDFYETSFYLQKGGSADEMIKDLSDTADKYDVHIFKIYEREKNTYSTSLDIYADEETVNILTENYGLSQGKFKSLFSGSTEIRVYRFSDISEELLKKDETYYLFGDSENMILFKQDLVNTYAGSFPKNDGFNGLNSFESMLSVAWIFVIAIVVLLTIYDTLNQKREILIRLTIGERIGIVYWKNVVLDTVYMLILFAILKVLMKNIEGNLIFDTYSNIMFFIMILINGIAFLGVLKVDYKLAMASSASKNNVLNYNYFLSGICMILLSISIGSCVELAFTAYDYSKQETYFEEHRNYNWHQRLLMEDEKRQNLQMLLNEFMAENSEDFFYLCQGGDLEENSQKIFYEASSGAKEYLQSQIFELKKELDLDTYILISKKNSISDSELEYLLDWIETEDYEIIYYSDSVDIIYRTFDEEPITERVNNPVMIFYNRYNMDLADDETFFHFDLGMLEASSSKWEEFADEHNISYVATNAWDFYCYRWDSLSRTVLLNVVIIIIMFIMYMLLSCVIIKMEFKINAKELALKKIHGYHIFERFGKIYTITGVIGVLSLICLFIMKLVMIEINFAYIVFLILAIICIEFLYITCQIVLYEKKNLKKILKGGNI